MQQFDIIIAGSGAAGLSLAWYLSHSPWLNGKSVLLLDKSRKSKNDRTWGFWTDEPTAFDEIVSCRFSNAEFKSARFSGLLPLAPYQYQVIKGSSFYAHVQKRLRKLPNFHFRQEEIRDMASEREGGVVRTNDGVYRAQWVFNSCFVEEELKRAARSGLCLQQHFKGWVLRSPEPAFDTSAVRLFDFRMPQCVAGQKAMQFFYLIPYALDRALVEYTLFSSQLLEPAAYEQALEQYVGQQLGLHKYQILEEEWGVIPMTTYRFPVRRGSRIVNIGTAGGASKPSTGYTFLRIQQHCQRLVRQLEAGEVPYAQVESRARFHLYDAMLLNIMEQKGEESEKIFSELFGHNPVARILKFLDEGTHLGEELKIMNSVPRGLFIRSLLNLKLGLPFG